MIIGCGERRLLSGGNILYTFEDLIDICNRYTGSFEAFFYICHHYFIWRAPNADFHEFKFDPMTGREIDWDNLYEAGKESIKDYSEKLEQKLLKGHFSTKPGWGEFAWQ